LLRFGGSLDLGSSQKTEEEDCEEEKEDINRMLSSAGELMRFMVVQLV
jgi:hypothetical protein